jgi:ribonuclease BN (tRNA processing enzyme)
MKIWVLGTGDAFSEQRYNTSFVVQSRHDNFFDGFSHLAVECPHPYRKVLLDCKTERELGATFHYPKLEEIDHFLVSHLHGDHVNGLEDVIFYKRFVQGIYPRIYMSQGDLDKLWKNRLKCAMGTSYNGESQFEVAEGFLYHKHSLPEGLWTPIGPFDITVRATNHHIPAVAMIIREEDKSIAFSSDTEFDTDLISWLCQADFIIHEATGGLGHTSYEELMALPSTIKDKMALIHYSDDFLSSDKEIRVLREGEVLEI